METSQQNKILEILADYRKHCLTNELYMKDDRARISGLRKKGYVFNEGVGWCEEPTHRHSSKVKLRQLISSPHSSNSALREAFISKVEDNVKLWNSQFKRPEVNNTLF